MALELRKATRQKAKLRIGLSGPAGSGKTHSALLLAKGIASQMSKVGVIDTENGSADLYSHLGEYNVIRLESPYTPERYIEALDMMEKAGIEVIIIDSVSHEWDGEGGVLQINEKLASAKFRGNTWAAWSETTPRHQKFIDRIVSSSAHVITCARSKTDTIQTEDKKVKKVGMKEIQREGFEYELTLNFNLDRDGHLAIASKDRTNLFIKSDPFKIDETTGISLKEWADSGVEPVKPTPDYTAIKNKINHNLKRLNFVLIGRDNEEKAKHASKIILHITGWTLKPENYEAIVTALEAYKDVDDAHLAYEEDHVPLKEAQVEEVAG